MRRGSTSGIATIGPAVPPAETEIRPVFRVIVRCCRRAGFDDSPAHRRYEEFGGEGRKTMASGGDEVQTFVNINHVA